MLPLSIVATIFTKLWEIDNRQFFRMFLSWSVMEREENIGIVLKELPGVDILCDAGWDRELMFLSQQLTHLGIEFNVHSLLFYGPCLAIFFNQSVPENLEKLGALAMDYPLARFAKNLFSIFYQTEDANAAVEDLIQMTMVPHICREMDDMMRVLRRIHHCHRPWEENCAFSYNRVPKLCDGWVWDEAMHFNPSSDLWHRPTTPDVRHIQCRRCKVAVLLFQFCFYFYDYTFLD